MTSAVAARIIALKPNFKHWQLRYLLSGSAMSETEDCSPCLPWSPMQRKWRFQLTTLLQNYPTQALKFIPGYRNIWHMTGAKSNSSGNHPDNMHYHCWRDSTQSDGTENHIHITHVKPCFHMIASIVRKNVGRSGRSKIFNGNHPGRSGRSEA